MDAAFAAQAGGPTMIKLSMVAVPPTDERLATIRQIGVESLVHYDMSQASEKYDSLQAFIARARAFGLAVPVVEAGPPINRIVMGKEGWEAQTRDWIRCLDLLGRLGVEVVCYNFMPQISDDAMVVRTDFAARTRGGARTSAYRAADVTAATVPHGETAIPFEQMQENLRRFLLAVIPAAEAAGVKLAMHPDDPPATPICGLQRVMSSVAAFDWLLDLHPSPMNGITLCAGCFGELGVDVPSLVPRFGGRIHFVHLRNIDGTPGDFIETFPDEGNLDLGRLVRTLHEAGFDGYVRPDHSPLLASERPDVDGYGFQGHLFTLGYIRGLLDAVTRGPKG
jgi:mannonate dehydratase